MVYFSPLSSLLLIHPNPLSAHSSLLSRSDSLLYSCAAAGPPHFVESTSSPPAVQDFNFSFQLYQYHFFRRRLPPLPPLYVTNAGVMASNIVKTLAKSASGYQFTWREKLAKHKDELAKGVWGYWELGAWKPLGISARRRARLRKEVLTAGEDWPYDPERKEMRTKRKGHKCDRISAEKRAQTAELMKKMPQMLLDYKKRRWEKKMKDEDSKK